MGAVADRTIWATPLLRWAGSKRQLVPTLLAALPAQFVRYVEPFAGSACLFFALHPAKALINDLNTELMGTYEAIQSHPRLVARKAASYDPSPETYYRLRAADPLTLPTLERAARFIYLNRHCFNGIYRVNRQGQFNVPVGRRTGQLLPEPYYVRCSIALRAAVLEARDYRAVLARCRRGDFVYLDPPYTNPSRRHKGEYGYDTFSERELPEFADALRDLDSRGIRFLVSYADAPAFQSIAAEWPHRRVTVRRTISCTPVRRQHTAELLVANYPMGAA